MTLGVNNFNDFPEIVPTRDITTQNTEKTFLVASSVAVVYFLNGPNAAASTAPTLIQHWVENKLSAGYSQGPLQPKSTILRRLVFGSDNAFPVCHVLNVAYS